MVQRIGFSGSRLADHKGKLIMSSIS